MGSLQELYHIIGARNFVRKLVRKCTVCVRASSKTATQLMGQLPSARVLPTFSVDYAGPLTLKIGAIRKPTYTKAYAAIFMCLVTNLATSS